jgi:hypothetical protein
MKMEEANRIKIQQTLEDASEKINIETLTGLMGELLSIA